MKASIKSQYVVDAKGQKQAVLLDIEQYQQMLEDLHDLRVVAERKSEARFSFSSLVRKLKNNGTI